MSMDKRIGKKKWPPERIRKYNLVGIFVIVIGYLLIFKTGGSTLNVKTERLTISTVKSEPESYFSYKGFLFYYLKKNSFTC